ncbi:hypothetical protein ACH0CG_02415 [Microbacterium sp. 179-I 1D1 NHS]|uniref:hypothetical protein n=1 Tax=Microbacterium sp. 179-I 1D1 NHS TaxID=3374298 RepID=UPI00387A8387
MFDDSQWAALIGEVMKLTEGEKLTWQADEQPLFIATVGDIEYVLGSVDNDGRAPYFFGIFDPTIRQYLAKLESQPVSSDSWGGQTPAQMVPGLYARVKRAATGADKLFSSLLTGLRNLDSPF